MNKKYFERKNPRLKSFDYASKGYYFLTICTKDKKHFFGEIENEKMRLSDLGKSAEEYIDKIGYVYENVTIDKYVVMPNHIHLILIIDVETDVNVARIIKQYKEKITKISSRQIWQKSYYDHIIRDENDYLKIWEYIDENIVKWSLDKYYE